MADQAEILDLIYEAIDTINEDQDDDAKIAKMPETTIYSKGEGVDSLVFIYLVGEIQDLVEDKLGAELNLMDEDAINSAEKPFATVASLAGYIQGLLQQVNAG